MLLKPWDERKTLLRSNQAAGAGRLSARSRASMLRVQPAAVARLARRPAGADGDQFDRRLQLDLQCDGEDEGRRAQERAVHRRRTAISTSTSRWCGVKVDRSKASDLGVTMQSIGNTLALMVGGNYVNRFNLAGPLLRGHSAGAARRPADAGVARSTITCRPRAGPAGAAVDAGSRSRPRPTPTR